MTLISVCNATFEDIHRAEVRELKFFVLECFTNQLITESINVGEVLT